MNKQLMVVWITFLLLGIGLSGCFDNNDLINDGEASDEEGLDPRDELSSVLGSVLINGIDEDKIAQLVSSVNLLKVGQTEEALTNLPVLSELLGQLNLSEVVIDPPSVDSDFFSGLYFTDVREARISLANMDKIKSDGFNTILIQIQMMAYPNGTLYVPGKEVYLFYINAFRASGFRVWLAVGHTAYEFPYRFDSPSHVAIPLENQTEAFDLVELQILEWAEVAEKFKVDTYIPLEETNTLLIEYGGEHRRLDDEERIFLNEWAQEILTKAKHIFSGKIAFSIEDWGPLDPDFDPSEGYPISEIGPDFDYRGYDFVAIKGTYLNGLSQEHWTLEINSRLSNANKYAERDNVDGVVWYEAGTPIGKGLNSDLGAHLITLSDEDQSENFKNIFEIVEEHNLSGVFFKISPPQPHEGTWSFFNKPAEQVLKDNFTKKGILESKSIDDLWIALGEEGLKVVQLAISPDVPFDPDYSLDKGYYNGIYHEMELTIDGGCYGYDC